MLIGRSTETAAIAALVHDVLHAGGRAILLSGEAGIGKTALLQHAREVAADAGVQLLTTTGMEVEAALPYAALVDLATPLLEHLDRLPPAQRQAVSAALAIDGAGPGTWDRLATCAGLLGLLRAAAEERPTLVIVDDVHWLDAPSAECLGYVARRLDGGRASLIIAGREGQIPAVVRGPTVAEHAVRPLSDEEAGQLLRQGADIAAPTVDRIRDAAHGNPLALTEMAAALTDAQRDGTEPYEPFLVPGGQLWHAFRGRIDALGPAPLAAALIVALAYDQSTSTVLAALERTGRDHRALEHGERSGIVVIEDGRARLRHPLMRSALLASIDAPTVREAHAALAAVSAPDPAAWHQAEAALGAGDEAAGALDGAGWRAVQRGAHLAAAEAFDRSAQLTRDAMTAAQRRFFAAVQFGFGGAYERAASTLEFVGDDAGEELAAAARHIRAIVGLVGATRPVLEHLAVLEAEADRLATSQPAIAAPLLADAAMVAVVGGECRHALHCAERGAALLPADAPPLAVAQVYSMLAMGRAFAGDAAGARSALAMVAPRLEQIDPLSPMAGTISFGLHARICTGEAAALRDDVLAMAAVVRESGANGLVPHYLLVAGDAALRLGRWAAAAADIDEAATTAELCGQHGPLAAALVVRARLRAACGQVDGAREDLATIAEIAARAGYVASGVGGRAAAGFLELTEGRVAEAIVELEAVRVAAADAGFEDPITIPWAPDLVEAFVASGRLKDAADLADRFVRQARRSEAPLALALAARLRGMVADDFDAPFREALDLHEQGLEAPFEEARTRLLYGARLHRARRRADAREHLRAARDLFERLEAAPWVARADAELIAAGATPRPDDRHDDDLTAHERRIALAVARGATNREVAAELFLSPKTVEFHLSRVYRKLGIRSRTQLAALAADGALGDAPAVAPAIPGATN